MMPQSSSKRKMVWTGDMVVWKFLSGGSKDSECIPYPVPKWEQPSSQSAPNKDFVICADGWVVTQLKMESILANSTVDFVSYLRGGLSQPFPMVSVLSHKPKDIPEFVKWNSEGLVINHNANIGGFWDHAAINKPTNNCSRLSTLQLRHIPIRAMDCRTSDANISYFHSANVYMHFYVLDGQQARIDNFERH